MPGGALMMPALICEARTVLLQPDQRQVLFFHFAKLHGDIFFLQDIKKGVQIFLLSVDLLEVHEKLIVDRVYFDHTNFDHKFDEKDYLADKGLNLYCLESNVSFSLCFQAGRGVTLIGQRSAGGTCYVCSMVTASGSFINISKSLTEVSMMNGSFYNVDRGAEPDISFSKIDSYYDRESLVEFIHGLK